MSDAEISMKQSSLAAGTSQPVHIRVPASSRTRKVRYRVTDQGGKEVQSQEFDLPSDVNEIAWFVEAPPKVEGGKLNMHLTVDDEPKAHATIDIESA